MKAMLRGFVGLGLVALLTSPALAQGRGFGMMRGGGGISALLSNESVQKELKLDDAQLTKVKELAEKNREKMMAAREETKDLDQEERMKKMQELMKEMNESTIKAVGEFMKPEQVKRLHECSYQVRGAMAFADPGVIKKLNITDAQKDDIKKITDESMEAAREIGAGFRDDPEGTQKKMAEHNKETLTKVVAKLNDEQQKTWKEMLGASFEYKPTPSARATTDSIGCRSSISRPRINRCGVSFSTNHSTVTLLARFRGLSISRPSRSATWYASSCKGTTARSG